MPAPNNYVEYKDSKLHYSTSGAGPTPLLLFHGFGQDRRAFEEWFPGMEAKYRLYAFDLYFHGQSTWPSRKPLEKQEWKEIMLAFLEKEDITTCEVVAFSLGGKFALATLEAFPDRVKHLTLLAPDGIKTNIWYNFATYPLAIRALFKSTVLHPTRFYMFAKFFRTLGLVNKGLVRFAESQMDTEEKRRRVYYSWVYFRHLKFDYRHIASILNTNKIPLVLIVGKFDRVIRVVNMFDFLSLLDQKKFEILEAGHNDLIKAARGLLGNQPV